jgi:UDP-2,3-diacylglucosamine pyrophosphatase LpxH
MLKKRKLHTVVLSDVHLGTKACCAGELLSYLNSINPKNLILNGNIVDFNHYGEKYFPKSQIGIIKRILDLSAKGTQVYYLSGNTDYILQRFTKYNFANVRVLKELTLDLDGRKAWFFHGYSFITTSWLSKSIAKWGKLGMKLVLWINKTHYLWRNHYRYLLHTGSRSSKNEHKNSSQNVARFEKTTSDLAITKGYKYVVCGATYHPRMIRKVNKKGICLYLNSGDWVKNLTALEYCNKRWKLYSFKDDKLSPFYSDEELKSLNYNDLLASIMVSGKSSDLKTK